MLPGGDDCDECVPGGSFRAPGNLLFAFLPFILTFVCVAALVLQRVFPFLSGETASLQSSASNSLFPASRPTQKRISAVVFSSTIALATVLAELILCEISNTLNPAARARAIKATLSLLLLCLIIAIPFLEIQSIITGAGYSFVVSGNSRLRTAWVLQCALFAGWIATFWWSGNFLLGRQRREKPILENDTQSLVEASLERIGVIGISIMSLLSGFASVSSPWHNFFSRPRPVTEASIARKQAGLEATQDMLATKRSRLRAIERKLADAPSESFFQKALGSLRGQGDQHERQMLLLEVNGLETMAASLTSSHAALKARRNQQVRAQTAAGRILLTGSYTFSVFCLYRIATTGLTFARRQFAQRQIGPADPARKFTTSDPVDNILAIVAKHYDPHLDQATWARQMSFWLSGIILFGSFSSVMQTFHFFSRFLPSLLKTIQANLALVVAQVCATYVISAALMLRGMMPGDVVGEGLRSIGRSSNNDAVGWIDGWFEKWFLGGVLVTAAAIWLGKRLGGGPEDWDDGYDEDGALEMGKRN